MNLQKLNLWRYSIFKQTKYLISQPESSQHIVFISETGIISKEILPMQTGYVTAEAAFSTWLVLHNLKVSVEDGGGGLGDEPYLLLSERSFIPLDPFKLLKPADKSGIMSLKTLARIKHDQERARVSKMGSQSARDKMLGSATNGALIILGLIICFGVVMRFTGRA